MRFLTTALVLLAVKSRGTAGPLDALQYRATLSTDLPPAAGPGEEAHLLPGAAVGVVVAGVPGWNPVAPAYPGAGFAVLGASGFTPFALTDHPGHAQGGGSGRYYLSLDFRDGSGQSAGALFAGRFEAGWWGGHGYAGPLYDYPPSPAGVGAPPVPVHPPATIWLGPSRYDLRLDYGWGPSYTQSEDGSWAEVWNAADSIPQRDGAYWTEPTGGFRVTLTPVQAPEPSSLALAAVGIAGLGLARRQRQ